MAWKIMETVAVPQEIADTSTTQNLPLGTIVTANDTTYGVGKFIYLKGAVGTAVGNAVNFDLSDWSTVETNTNSRGGVGIAMSANVAGPNYGWYQIYGTAIATVGTVADNGLVYSTSTPGTLDDAVVSTDKIDGAQFRSANGTPSAGLALVQLNYPQQNGNG